MPYIKSDNGRRKKLQNCEPALNAGELNYQIFYYVKYNKIIHYIIQAQQVKQFVKNFLGDKPNYQRYNDMVGCLVLCTIEIKRRLYLNTDILLTIIDEYDTEIANYEDLKIKENGDV